MRRKKETREQGSSYRFEIRGYMAENPPGGLGRTETGPSRENAALRRRRKRSPISAGWMDYKCHGCCPERFNRKLTAHLDTAPTFFAPHQQRIPVELVPFYIFVKSFQPSAVHPPLEGEGDDAAIYQLLLLRFVDRRLRQEALHHPVRRKSKKVGQGSRSGHKPKRSRVHHTRVAHKLFSSLVNPVGAGDANEGKARAHTHTSAGSRQQQGSSSSRIVSATTKASQRASYTNEKPDQQRRQGLQTGYKLHACASARQAKTAGNAHQRGRLWSFRGGASLVHVRDS